MPLIVRLSLVCYCRNKFASFTFFMCKSNSYMFWGGEFTKQMDMSNQRRNIAHINGRSYELNGTRKSSSNPTFEFRVKSGAPLTSRWVCYGGTVICFIFVVDLLTIFVNWFQYQEEFHSLFSAIHLLEQSELN